MKLSRKFLFLALCLVCLVTITFLAALAAVAWLPAPGQATPLLTKFATSVGATAGAVACLWGLASIYHTLRR